MKNLLPNSERATAIILLFRILIVVYILSLVSNILQVQLLEGAFSDFLAGTDFNNFRQGIISGIRFIVVILCMIYFIKWFRRAYHNLHKAKVSELTYGEGWAAGAWFVPIMNLFAPYKIMLEIWNGTYSYVTESNNKDALTETTPNDLEEIHDTTTKLIGLWWALYIISRILDTIGGNMALERQEYESILSGTYLVITADILAIGSLFIIIKIIQNMKLIEPAMRDIWYNKQEAHFDFQNTSDDIII